MLHAACRVSACLQLLGRRSTYGQADGGFFVPHSLQPTDSLLPMAAQ